MRDSVLPQSETEKPEVNDDDGSDQQRDSHDMNRLDEGKQHGKKLVFITHAPIYKTKLDYIYKEHRGCKSSRKFVEKFKPVLTLCGHFHETENKSDKINETLIINPGHKGSLIEI